MVVGLHHGRVGKRYLLDAGRLKLRRAYYRQPREANGPPLPVDHHECPIVPQLLICAKISRSLQEHPSVGSSILLF
jgi:hypothetical protein